MLGARTYFVQHISQWPFTYFEWYWYCYSYTEDTLYKACHNDDSVVESLRMSSEKLIKWFKHNQMKSNTYKCQLILLILSARDSIKSKLKIHWLNAASMKNFMVLNLIVSWFLVSTSKPYVQKQMQNLKCSLGLFDIWD